MQGSIINFVFKSKGTSHTVDINNNGMRTNKRHNISLKTLRAFRLRDGPAGLGDEDRVLDGQGHAVALLEDHVEGALQEHHAVQHAA